VGPSDGDQTGECELGTAPEADVSVEPFVDGHGRPVDIEGVDYLAGVRFDPLVVTGQRVGRLGFDDDPRRIECDSHAAVESVAGEREVPEAEVESRPGLDGGHTTRWSLAGKYSRESPRAN